MKNIAHIYLETLDSLLLSDTDSHMVAFLPERFLSYDKLAVAIEKRGIDLADFRELCKIFSEFDSHVTIDVLEALRKLLPIERND